MQDLGKFLVIAGVLIAIVGGGLWSGRGLGWLGRLPGDISYKSDHFQFYFPLVTCILVSVVLTLITWLLRR